MASLKRNSLLAWGLASVAWLARAQAPPSYPERAITLVAPTPPGGGTDTIARYFAERLSTVLKQPVIVDNRPGANGILGTDNVAHAPKDGYRLLFTYTAAQVVNPAIMKKLPYDALKDFTPVAQIGRGGVVLLVSPKLPVKNLAGFIDHAKARPNQLNYCSWGNGSGGHLVMEKLKKQAALAITHVPYKGSAACLQDIMAGQVEAGYADAGTAVELVRSGKLRALAISTPQRVYTLPDLPTLDELGYPFGAYTWYGVFAPAGTPQPVVDKLNGALQTILKDPATVQRMREMNFSDLPLTTPAQFADTVRQDMALWGEIARSLNLSLD